MRINKLNSLLKGKVVILGMGNVLRGDDGLGPALIARLKGRINAVCLNAGSAPENYLGKIVKQNPDVILIVDALHLGKAPGEYQLLESGNILNCGLTTHDISAKMLIEYLGKETGAKIQLLGVQPKNLAFGEQFSQEVKTSLDALTDIIRRALPCTKPI